MFQIKTHKKQEINLTTKIFDNMNECMLAIFTWLIHSGFFAENIPMIFTIDPLRKKSWKVQHMVDKSFWFEIIEVEEEEE